MRKISKNFKQRLAVSAVGIFLLLSTIYLSTHGVLSLLFPLLVSALIACGVGEFYQIAKGKGWEPLFKLGIFFSILYVFAAYLSTQFPTLKAMPEAVLGATLLTAFSYYFLNGTDPFVNLAVTLFGIFYLTVPLTCTIYINYYFPANSTQDHITQDGRLWIIYLLAVTKITDTGAYFIGKTFGTKKIAPYISPKKTWEGSIGGLLSAVFTSLLFSLATPLDISFFQAIWLGVAISILAQFGDLAESLLKRDLGIKDSNQLPGIGGILDSLDSLVFTAPFVYLFLKFTHSVI